MKKLITTILGAIMIAVMILAPGCKKNSAEPGGGGGPDIPTSKVYLGVIGFNDSIFVKEVSPMDTAWIEDFQNFVRYTYYTEVSKLYYSERKALDIMKDAKLPESPRKVALITLTDGIDYGSLSSYETNPDNFATKAEYLEYLHNKITTEVVHGCSIDSYTIGYVENPAQVNINEFRNNLEMLASDEDKYYETDNMDSVAEYCKSIADTLHTIVADNGTIMLVFDLDCSYSLANGGGGSPWPYPNPEPPIQPQPTPQDPPVYPQPIPPQPPVDEIINEVVRIVYDGRWSEPEVITHPVTITSPNSGTCGGDILSNGGNRIIRKGVVWSDTHDPNIEDDHTDEGPGSESFTSEMTNLEPNKQYYVRAYAENRAGIGYGQLVIFTTGGGGVQSDDFEFSVSPTKKVSFSPGNLQYNKGTGTWRFAEHQWDVVGENNESVSYEWYTGWLDVFGWGTADDPTCTVDSCDYYGYSVFAEWGNNPISNGVGSHWYTLTSEEWDYVVFGRAAANRPSFVMANVHDINGIVLLPDGWDINYSFERLNEDFFQGMPEYISDSDWSDILEMNGAVFLPAAGIRTHLWWKDDEGNYTEPHHDYDMMNEMALYWSKTPAPTEWRDSTIQVRAYAMQMWYIPGLGATMAVDAGLRCDAVSVRLVKDI